VKNVEYCLGKCYYNAVYKIVGETAFHLYGGCCMKKNKIGFTLIEMMTVVAIIILLTTALTFSVSTYMGKARSVSSAASIHVNNYDSAKNQVNALNLASPATTTAAPLFKVIFHKEPCDQIVDIQYIAFGEDATSPPADDAYWLCHVFVGWTGFTNVTGPLDVYAIYKDACTVSFTTHSHGSNPVNQIVAQGSTASKPFPDPDSYTTGEWHYPPFPQSRVWVSVTHNFAGWYYPDGAASPYNFDNPVNNYMLLSAHFS